MLLFSPLLIFLNPTVLCSLYAVFFYSKWKLFRMHLLRPSLSLFRAPKSRGGQNESPPNDPFSVENVFYFCHLGKKLIVDLGFPKYRWGAVVHSVSQVFAFICLKGTACVTCQLFRKVWSELIFVFYFCFYLIT